MKPSSSATWVTLLAAVSAISVEAACRRDGLAPSKPAVTVPVASAAPPADAGIATAEAGPKAEAPTEPADATLRVVAEADLGSSGFSLTSGDRLVVTSGTFVYEAKPDGSLALQGAPETYGPLFPGSEETILGYVSHARPTRIIGAGKGFDVKLSGDEGAAFHVEDGTLSMLDAKSLGASTVDAAVEVDGAPKGAKCLRLPSFDGKSYARCTVGAEKARKISFHASEGGVWRAAFTSATDADDTGSVGADGALYAPVRGEEKVVRCTESGCEALAMETKVEASGAPTYQLSYTDVMDPNESRYWATIRVAAPARLEGRLGIQRVVARSRGDVWVVATSGAVNRRVFLHSGPLGGKAHVSLPSDIDGRVLARNAKAPAPWVGHCDQVFVKVASAKGDGAIDKHALESRAGEIKKMVPAQTEDEYYVPYGYAIVEGRLYDEHVAGVIIHRNDAAASLDRMERFVDKLADKLAANPMARPPAYCTLPVLTAIVAPAN